MFKIVIESETLSGLLVELKKHQEEIRHFNQMGQLPAEPGSTGIDFKDGNVGKGTQDQIDRFGELGKYITPNDYLLEIEVDGEKFQKSTLQNKPNSYGVRVPNGFLNIEVFKGKWVMNRKVKDLNGDDQYIQFDEKDYDPVVFPDKYREIYSDVLIISTNPR